VTALIQTEIAVIGAGVIGLATAHRLRSMGREVVLIDPAEPGSGASYGNAGTIADYAVLPVGTPDVLRNLPSLLFDRNSPLSIRRAALPSLAPWLLRFARQSLPAAAKRNSAALATLLSDACVSWQGLADEVSGAPILQRNGCLYLYETKQAYDAAAADMAYRRGFGISVDLISPQELQQLEPGLPEVEGGAAFFPGAVFLNDPGRMMGLLAAGLTHIRAKVDWLGRRNGGVFLVGDGFQMQARRVVIAAGAHSKTFARMVGDLVPLDTERGYHLEWDMESPRLSRPTCPTSRGFYLCPMEERLRVAGTVELGGLEAPPSRHRLDRLQMGARALFPDLGKPDREWMGFRPSMPDSLPVIGYSKGGPEVIHAFGHGHIGLTLAPITARIVADLVAGKEPEVDIRSYSSGRF
jgi:D-hydroxyproline dehydrogenase